MANITVLEALQLSLNATKKYVDDNKFSKNYEDLNNEPFTFVPIKLTETNESNGATTAYCDVFDLEQGHRYVADFTKYDYVCLYTFNSDNTKNTLVTTTSYLSTNRNGMITIMISSATKRDILWMSAYGSERITVTKNSDGTFTIANSLIVPRVTNTREFTPTSDYHLVHKKYVDEKVAEANASGGYTHPDSHPASMITGLATVATSGSYNDLTNKPIIPIKTSELTNDSGFITSIPAEYVTDTYLNNKLSSMPKSLAGHDGAQVLSYIDKHNVLERENMVDKAFQVFTSLFYSTSTPTSGDISNLSVVVVDFANTIMNACTEFGEDIFLYFDFIFDSPIKFVVTPYSSSNMFSMIIDNGMTRVGLQIEFTGDGTGQYTRTSTELVTSNKIATVATSGDYNDLNNKPTIPSIDGLASESYVNNAVAGLVDSAPEALNTLNELATALGNDANFATTISNQIGLKVNSADLATVATSGDYNDLTNRPIKVLPDDTTVADLYNLEMGIYLLTNNIEFNITDDTNMENGVVFNKFSPFTLIIYRGNGMVGDLSSNIYYVFTSDGSLISAGTTNNSWAGTIATVATTGSYNDLTDKPTIPTAYTHPATHPASMITGLSTVATSGSYADLTNKPTIPTVTNDLTNALKSNYDTAYTHSQSAHAPANAQKNSDITKAEIEAKLTGNITSHTHSQYLTSIPAEYITEAELNAKGYALIDSPDFTGDVSMGRKAGTTVGKNSVALGIDATAIGVGSHAEGVETTASGDISHAEGGGTIASGVMSHAEGGGTIASSENQHVQGKFNIEDTENKYAHIVGNGEYDYNTNEEVRSNAHTLDWSGNAWFAGKVTVGTAPTANMDVATKQYVDNAVANAGGSGGSGSAADYGPYSVQYNSENNRLEFIYTPTN